MSLHPTIAATEAAIQTSSIDSRAQALGALRAVAEQLEEVWTEFTDEETATAAMKFADWLREITFEHGEPAPADNAEASGDTPGLDLVTHVAAMSGALRAAASGFDQNGTEDFTGAQVAQRLRHAAAVAEVRLSVVRARRAAS